jgi:hypothetical protein
MFENNLVKPFYIIEVKIKTKYKTYLSNYCDMLQSYIHFQGVEIEETTKVNTLEDANTILEGNKTEVYYPWQSIVNIELKRLLKKQ